MNTSYTRRDWLTRNAVHTTAGLALSPRFRGQFPLVGSWVLPHPARPTDAAAQAAHVAAQAERIDRGPWQVLAQRAVDAARSDGAMYADARLTRTVIHYYFMSDNGGFWRAFEHIGVGVRALVHGYWGFVAAPYLQQDEVVQRARDAVAQAKSNAKGPPRTVELGQYPVVTGAWATPVKIDPFTISIEEKCDYFTYWKNKASDVDVSYQSQGLGCLACFVRQERVVATSDGSLFTQTCYESGGNIDCVTAAYVNPITKNHPQFTVPGLGMAGQGWERFFDADLPAQFPRLREEAIQFDKLSTRPATIGRYTLVCDGQTMASVLDHTLGVATQLDRALGYEADAGGTSFIDDPLAMLGTYQAAAPLVTVTANRSVPAGLATVKWDDEGVVPPDSTLIKEGVLVDFQTTREQSAWLAPYYQQRGRPVRSNGCAAAQDALSITMQQMPNLSLEPSTSPIRLEDLVTDVKNGILLENGYVDLLDFQARNGMIWPGRMREIRNGRLGSVLNGGAIWFNTVDLWKHLTALGGSATQGEIGPTWWFSGRGPSFLLKGQPPQGISHTVRAVAATIPNQPLINPAKKA